MSSLCRPVHWCPAAEEERHDWALYAENVRRLMGERLGQPLVEQASQARGRVSQKGLALRSACAVPGGTAVVGMAAAGGGGAWRGPTGMQLNQNLHIRSFRVDV